MANKEKKHISDIPLLLLEWDWGSNNISPFETSYGSAKTCFWKCSVCGHSWDTPAYSRGSNGCGCPECAKKNRGISKMQNSAKKNSLAVLFPDIARELHPRKNGAFSAENLSCCSNKRLWWICSTCGNEWQTTVNHRTNGKTGCPKCSKSLSAQSKSQTHARNNNFALLFPEIVREWDTEKNIDLKPKDVSASSNKKVWWKCGFCGNEWQTTVGHRTAGEGCPSCSTSQTSFPEQAIYFYILKKFPDAINRYKWDFEFDIYIPSLKTAIEYDGAFFHISATTFERDNLKDSFCKNNGITLIRFRSPRLKDTKHALRITIEDYQLEKGILQLFKMLPCECPPIDIDRDRSEIIQKFRSIQVTNSIHNRFPAVATEWHPTKNGSLSPNAVASMSNKNFWWICHQCGYEWKDTPNHRCSRGSGCPLCAGKVVVEGVNDLSTTHPDLCKEWYFEKNAPFLPTQSKSQSNKKVWWKCLRHNHEWQAAICDRARKDRNTGCPYCRNKRVLRGFNDLMTTNPHLSSEWSLKNSLSPAEVTEGSHKKVWWHCSECGHEWQAAIYSRKKNGCPNCSLRKNKKAK